MQLIYICADVHGWGRKSWLAVKVIAFMLSFAHFENVFFLQKFQMEKHEFAVKMVSKEIMCSTDMYCSM